MKLEFGVDDSGNQVLCGRKFENTQFSDLEIVPPVGRQILIDDCKFLNCSTSPGTCVIGSDVTLHSVEISDLVCGDAIRISSEATLANVVIAGKNPKALILQPEYQSAVKLNPSKSECQLDISAFLGEVVIIGLHSNSVRRDSNRHVVVQAKWKNEVNWNLLGIGPHSYWRIFLLKLSLCKADEGIFSLPDATDKNYAETIRQREILESSGIQFS